MTRILQLVHELDVRLRLASVSAEVVDISIGVGPHGSIGLTLETDSAVDDAWIALDHETVLDSSNRPSNDGNDFQTWRRAIAKCLGTTVFITGPLHLREIEIVQSSQGGA